MPHNFFLLSKNKKKTIYLFTTKKTKVNKKHKQNNTWLQHSDVNHKQIITQREQTKNKEKEEKICMYIRISALYYMHIKLKGLITDF